MEGLEWEESFLETDVKPDIKKVDIIFQEGESLTIEITHPEDKEDILGEKQAPKTAEATIDVVTQNIASTFEISNNVLIISPAHHESRQAINFNMSKRFLNNKKFNSLKNIMFL